MTQARIRALYIVSKIALDALMTAAAFILAYQFRRLIPFPDPLAGVAGFVSYLPMLVVQVFSVIGVFYFNKLYHVVRATSRVDELYAIFGAVSIGTMMAVAISTLTFKNSIFEFDFPRAMILYAWMLSILLIALGREVHRRVWHHLRMRGIGRDRVLVVGSGEAARAIVQKIQWSPYLGYDLVGVVNGSEQEQEIAGAPILGSVSELPDIIDRHEVQEVILALPEGSSRHDIIRLVSLCQRGSVAIKIFPDLFELITTGVSIDDLGGIPLLNVRDIQLRGWKLSLKRAMDIIGAGIGLVLLSPLMMLFAFLIKLESPGPVFYCQERMGLDGRPFQMIKFRSMRQDAEKNGPGWTTPNDPRRTRLGAWLRSKNIDELPQLINVLLGDMSLVGPRPERPVYVQRFRQAIPRYMERHREKAGITGWAQINGLRGDTSIAERTKYDLWYVENWSLWLDIKIIVRTILMTLFGSSHNAY
ncbi:MAG TPA: undecaprenyl-phosphate glucose phosphotransferase [Chloroflexi bacterium]|nr:undecaprenyl-phosphate glucose phosphotransferase [Chloroflexota bacterium]